jgi:hypothetical protein
MKRLNALVVFVQVKMIGFKVHHHV